MLFLGGQAPADGGVVEMLDIGDRDGGRFGLSSYLRYIAQWKCGDRERRRKTAPAEHERDAWSVRQSGAPSYVAGTQKPRRRQ